MGQKWGGLGLALALGLALGLVLRHFHRAAQDQGDPNVTRWVCLHPDLQEDERPLRGLALGSFAGVCGLRFGLEIFFGPGREG